MNTDRRRHDPFAPRRKAQTQTSETPAPAEQPAPSEAPAKSTPDFDAILGEIPRDIDHITLKELRALAAQADVPDYGTKAEIIARLRAAAAQ